MTTTLGNNAPSLNRFHSDKFSVVFSNIPSIDNRIDMQLYDLYVKSVTLPEYDMEFVPSHFKGGLVWHPISQDNDNLPEVIIEFKLSENLDNWFNLFSWLQTLRYRQPDTEAVQSTLLRKNTVKSIDVLLLDNQKRTKKKMSFKECFLSNLSSLPLVIGSSEEVTFTTIWRYQEVFLTDV